MLQDLQPLQIQEFISGGTNPITGESIPVAGCLPLPTAMTGLTATQNATVAKQLDIAGTVTAAQQALLVPGNYITILGVCRRIKSVNQFFLAVTLDNAWPTVLAAAAFGVSIKSKYRMVQILNTTTTPGLVREGQWSGSKGDSFNNSAGLEVIGYDATGTVFEFTVGI